MAGGVKVGGARVPAGTTCITCGYSLEGLTREGVCPECGTPIRKSLNPGVLDFLSGDGARHLEGATSLLLWVMRLVALNIALLLFVVIAQEVAFVFYLICGPVSWVLAAGMWVLAWIHVARVGEHGTGRGAGISQFLIIIAAWGQVAILGCALLYAAAKGWKADAVALGLFTSGACAVLTLVAGQWRLATLARRGGVSNLAKGGRDMSAFILTVVGLGTLGVLVGAFMEPAAGVALGLLAVLTGLFAIVGWFSFIRDLRAAARDRAGEGTHR